jgi:hypothetical protein
MATDSVPPPVVSTGSTQQEEQPINLSTIEQNETINNNNSKPNNLLNTNVAGVLKLETVKSETSNEAEQMINQIQKKLTDAFDIFDGEKSKIIDAK